MNTLEINGMYFHAHHGCLPEEGIIGGKYRVDVSIQATFLEAANSDELSKTADYEKVFEIVETEMQQRSKLIEAVAKRAAEALGARLPWANQISLTLTKYDPPIKGRRIEQAKITWIWNG